ncbi:hypothetical protein JST97_19110 [bacterium]|nr:hypothetical protein [bacterium]
MPAEAFWLEVGPFHIVPVCHHTMEFAHEVEKAFRAVRPRRVAIELAPFLLESMLRAVRRFPRLTTLAYEATVEVASSEVDGPELREELNKLGLYPEGLPARLKLRRHHLLSVEPTDAFAEAVRLAQAHDLPVHAIDLAMHYPHQHQDWVPDAASLTAIGARAFYELWSAKMGAVETPEDRDREANMALSLLNLARMNPDEKILVVVGLVHTNRLLAYLEAGDAPLKPPPAFEPGPVELYEPDIETVRMSHSEAPWVMALYEFRRGGPGGEEFWQPPPPPEPEPEDPRDRLKDVDPSQVVASLETMLGLRRRRMPPMDKKQRKALSRYLQGLGEDPGAFMQLLNQFGGARMPEKIEFPKVKAPSGRVQAFKFKEVRDRRADLRGLYAAVLEEAGPELDRQTMLEALMRATGHYYHENTGDRVANWQFQTLYQYVRNYARLHGRLLPTIYELTMGARGVADDNWAYEVWDLGSFYPWSPEEDGPSDLPKMHMDDNKLWLNGRQVISWQFNRKFPSLRKMRRRASESEAGDWAEEFEGGNICSYPVEDVVIEDYARYLQKKAIQQMSSEKSRTEPFTTSLLDGIDMRETLRNWHDRKLFVREIRRVTGGVGAVILIFDEDKNDDRYPWRMTWHGEHSQESDMAFYATPTNMKLVGPGISRCEYGGLLMTYPNRQLANVWADPSYFDLRSKSEILLMGALEYGQDRHVVYVGSTPPRSHFRSVAARLGKRIVYLPIGSLSPQSIQKIRIFHVLSDHQKRKIAKDYIW